VCTKEIIDHSDNITAIHYLQDEEGFVTGGMDGTLCFYVRLVTQSVVGNDPHIPACVTQDSAGKKTERSLSRMGLRVVDFALSPDRRYLIAVGQPQEQRILPGTAFFDLPVGMPSLAGDEVRAKRTQLVVFDLLLNTKRSYVSWVNDHP